MESTGYRARLVRGGRFEVRTPGKVLAKETQAVSACKWQKVEMIFVNR